MLGLECHDLSFRYPETDTDVFDGLSFRIDRPGFHALFGPSGVGKTTLARIISGELTCVSGTCETGGLRSRLYSYNLERLPGWASIGSHLHRVTPQGKEGLRDDLVEIFGLRDVTRSRFANLSLGQQNRVNLIRYLLQDFDLLIMDESLANVDERTRETILLEVKHRFPDRYFLYISHNVIEVSKFCRDIIVFRGADTHHRVAAVAGQDWRKGRSIDRVPLESTMLEIMNAAA